MCICVSGLIYFFVPEFELLKTLLKYADMLNIIIEVYFNRQKVDILSTYEVNAGKLNPSKYLNLKFALNAKRRPIIAHSFFLPLIFF